jgi:hypothetical protein
LTDAKVGRAIEVVRNEVLTISVTSESVEVEISVLIMVAVADIKLEVGSVENRVSVVTIVSTTVLAAKELALKELSSKVVRNSEKVPHTAWPLEFVTGGTVIILTVG